MTTATAFSGIHIGDRYVSWEAQELQPAITCLQEIQHDYLGDLVRAQDGGVPWDDYASLRNDLRIIRAALAILHGLRDWDDNPLINGVDKHSVADLLEQTFADVRRGVNAWPGPIGSALADAL